MGHLLILFIVVPVVELVLLVEIGQRVGTLATIGLIMVPESSARRWLGSRVSARLLACGRDLDAGRLPGEAIVLILVAAAVLITPGVLTDLVGFLCLVPACRRPLKRYVKRRFERAVREGAVNVSAASARAGSPAQRPPMKNVTPRPDSQSTRT